MYTQEENIQQPHQVHIITNGEPELVFTLHYKSFINYAQIQRAYESRWGVKLRRMRLFTDDGVYLKHIQNLYVSKGEEFDANSSFSQYKIIQPIGQGGFGKVSLAEHKITKQLVAIKVMKVSGFGNTSQIDLVFREAESLQALHHSNIVKILKYYTLKDMQVIVVMQYMEGGQLLNRLKQKGKFEQSQAKIYFKQLIKAIIYVHNKNIIHRDLKLQNILLKSHDQNKVKIADFGISGVTQHLNPKLCSGTLKYMSPEVLTGNIKQINASVDIWALGVIFYYMLFGKQPFIGPTTQSITSLIISGKYYVPPNTISIQAQQLLSRMLDRNPQTRIKAVEIRDHPWLKTSILQMPTDSTNSYQQKLREFQNRKQRMSSNQITPKIQQKIKTTKSVKIQQPKSISKHHKQNELKLPRLNKSIIINNKSNSKRDKTIDKKRHFDSLISPLNRSIR